MLKVTVCGHVGGGKFFLDGQTIKTKILINELKKQLGSNDVGVIDTFNWRRNPFKLIYKCILSVYKSKNLVMLPAKNGVKLFTPLFLVLNKLFNRKLHYIVIGGWLPELLENDMKLKKQLKKFDGIYVETEILVQHLRSIGMQNVIHLKNFKKLDILKVEDLCYQQSTPYKLCTFSRVVRKKGIEDAIEVVKSINEKFGKVVYTLDIYGQIGENYKSDFNKLQEKFPEYIEYRGSVNYEESVNVLKDYFLLLFPTHYKTEGIPGTIIDAYAAGLPVLASNWNSASEIIDQNNTGYLYDFKDKNELELSLIKFFENPSLINNCKERCLEKAKSYEPERNIIYFKSYL